MNEIATYENNAKLFSFAGDVAKEYGLFSKTVVKPNYSGKPDVYLVFGVKPIPADVNPVEIINRNDRSVNLFYPENFAVNITKENPLMAWDKITQYLTNAEIVCELYYEFQLPLPKKIRADELSGLITFCCGRDNPDFDIDTRKNYAQGLRDFFEEERSKKGKFKKEWHDFFRSDLFDGDKSLIRNFFAFLKRHEPETSLESLLESNFEFRKIYIPEHYYEQFREIIKKEYPDVKYSVSDLKVVDKGTIVDPKTGQRVVTQFGQCVTDKELDKIVEERFSRDGFKCTNGLCVTRYEGRDVFYKVSDENIIASVCNQLRLGWAKRLTTEELLENGKVEQIDIPISQMKRFYVGMQQVGIPFAIDNDANNSPQLDIIHVLYNKTNSDVVGKLVAGLTLANISTSHVHHENISFEFDLNQVDALISNAKQIADARPVEAIAEFSETEREMS